MNNAFRPKGCRLAEKKTSESLKIAKCKEE
jgi:hypothetical protein